MQRRGSYRLRIDELINGVEHFLQHLEIGGFVAAITRLSGAGGQCGRVGRRRRRVGGGGGVYIQLIERAPLPCLGGFLQAVTGFGW